MIHVELIPRDAALARAQLRDRFGDVDTLADALRDVLLQARTDPSVWQRESTAVMLQWCRTAGSCGGDLGDLLLSANIPPLLTKCSTEITKACCQGAADLDDALALCTSALSNACGGAARALSDVVCRVGGSAADESNDVVIGFADYASGETGGRLWSGAVLLALWFREEHLVENWLMWNKGPISLLELGCGPALVSAALCKQFQQVASSTSSSTHLTLTVSDVSEAVVAEATKTLAERNLFAPQMVVGGAELRWACRALDFASIPEDWHDAYDVVFGSDIVYDYAIAAHVPAALTALLRRGSGVAYLCCEAHRDAMKEFVPNIQRRFSTYLTVELFLPEVVLQKHTLPQAINPHCSLMIFRRTDAPWKKKSDGVSNEQ